MEALLEKNILSNLSVMNLTYEEVYHFEKLARDFSKKTILPMFEGDLADGDLTKLDDVLKKAFDIGIAASAKDSMQGSEYGVWGSSIERSGLLTSLVLLSVIAETCGGIAMCLHAQGLGVNLLQAARGKLPEVPDRPAVCLQEEPGMPLLEAITSPSKTDATGTDTCVIREETCYLINGSKRFVYGMPQTDALVVFARMEDQWGCFMIPVDSPGIEIIDAGNRTGLRACALNHVTFNNVQIPLDHRIDADDASQLVARYLTLNWIGMTAIAAGIARGAIIQAKGYARDRYQGGKQIEDHPIINRLIAEARAKTHTARASVFDCKNTDLKEPACIRRAAMVKLMGINLCAQAVTESLQVFGGYGYMEDFGMEKRLRDVTVLKSAHGAPVYLRRIIMESERREEK